MKTKLFSKYSDKRDVAISIADWIKNNQNVEIISVNVWGYSEYKKGIIIYK